MSFLPSWPVGISQLFLFSLLLLAGLAGGELAHRRLRLPRIIGYMLAGMFLGALYDRLTGGTMFAEARIFAEVALGLILFMLGRRLDLGWLRRDRWLPVISIAESAATFAAVFGLMSLFGLAPPWAAVGAAVAVCTSPAVVMLIVRDNRAQGQVTERLLCLTALNSVFAVLALSMLLSWLHLEYQGGWKAVLIHPLYLIGGSLLLAGAATFALLRAARWYGKSEAVQLVLIIGTVLIAVAVADMLRLSVLITLLGAGVLVRNLDRERSLLNIELGFAAEPLFVILFVVVGVRLPLDVIGGALLPAFAFFVARAAAKAGTVFALGYLSGMPAQKSIWMGLALAPMSAVAALLVSDAAALYPEFSEHLAAIVLGAVAFGTLVGPVATQIALRRAGETSEAS